MENGHKTHYNTILTPGYVLGIMNWIIMAYHVLPWPLKRFPLDRLQKCSLFEFRH